MKQVGKRPMVGTAPLRPTWALGEDIQQFLHMQGGWWPRALCPVSRSLQEHWLSPGRASLHCPLVLGGAVHPPESCHHGPLTA